jgi:hypothetical protein
MAASPGLVRQLSGSFSIGGYCKKWMTSIATCDALVAMLHIDFHKSNWTNQEIGFANARRLFLIRHRPTARRPKCILRTIGERRRFFLSSRRNFSTSGCAAGLRHHARGLQAGRTASRRKDRMRIDERLQRLKERQEALTVRVQRLACDVEKHFGDQAQQRADRRFRPL